MRQQKYLIGFAAFAALLFSSGCEKENGYRTEVIIRNSSLNRFANDFGGRINTTTQFLALFINSYRGTIRSSVRKEFYDKFPLLATNLGSRVLFSETAETVLAIYPSRTNSLTVDCAHLPAQFVLFSGLESDPKVRLLSNEEELLKYYKTPIGAVLAVLPERGYCLMKNFSYGPTYIPKLATVPANSLLLVQSVDVIFTSSSGSRTQQIDTAIFTGGLDFTATIPIAAKLGKDFAEYEIMDLFRSSELFRASLAHPQLKAIAEEIVSNSEKKKSGGEDYPYWRFLLDKDRLVEAAKRWNVSTAYADDFFRDYQTSSSGGTLFWRFSSNKGFMLQWTMFNCVSLFVALVLLRLRRTTKWFLASELVLFAVGGTNVWIFSQKPQFVGLKYWILPGIILLVAFLPLWLKRHQYASKLPIQSRS